MRGSAVSVIKRMGIAIFQQLPDRGYPSDHPWADREVTARSETATRPRVLAVSDASLDYTPGWTSPIDGAS